MLKLLEAYLKKPVNLACNSYGKPIIKNAFTASPIKFNTSHSDQIIMYAISTLPVGVDCEIISDKHIKYSSMLPYLTENEGATLMNLAASELYRNFLKIWTKKEAFTKGLGVGLHFPFCYIQIPDNDFIQVFNNAKQPKFTSWRCELITQIPGYIGAVAWKSAINVNVSIKTYDYYRYFDNTC